MATITSVQAGVLRRLLDAVVTGDRESMAGLVTDDVIAWSPNVVIRSRADLLEALDHRDDSFSDVDVDVQALDQIGDKAIAEWHVAATHTGPMVVDDGLVIAPTGRRLHLSGATIAEFDGDHVCAFRSYFDDLALVEQVLAGG
jgi:ketosteroid isomerase-like protein